jgi:hypothetical protein
MRKEPGSQGAAESVSRAYVLAWLDPAANTLTWLNASARPSNDRSLTD